MVRPLVLVALVGLAGFVLAGEPKSASGTLELKLPASAAPPSHAPERVSKLEIDGKDYSTPRNRTRTLAVEPKKGTDTVTVVY